MLRFAAPLPTPQTVPSFLLTTRSFTPLSARSALLVVDLGASTASYVAGQAMTLGKTGQPLRKPYSVACGPLHAARHGVLEFVIGLDEAGSPGAHLDGVAAGTMIEAEGPIGGFTLPPLAGWRQLVLIAGGSGIAPLRAMWQQALADAPATRIAVVYSARTPRDLAFVDELDALAAASRLDLLVTLTRETDAALRRSRGRVSRVHIEPLATPRALFALCGPPAFVAHVEHVLASLGVGANRILKEDW